MKENMDGWFNEGVPVSAMMGGTVTVVIHTALSTVIVTVFLGALVATITGTDVVISVQTGIRSINDIISVTQGIPDINISNIELEYELPAVSLDKLCL